MFTLVVVIQKSVNKLVKVNFVQESKSTKCFDEGAETRSSVDTKSLIT